jgi:UPF0755 protein
MLDTPNYYPLLEHKQKKHTVLRVFLFLFVFIIIAAGIGVGMIWQYNKPSAQFPGADIFRIEKGSTVQGVGSDLFALGYLRSKTLFQFFVLLLDTRGRVVAGDYFFDSPLSAYELASRVTSGNRNLQSYKITIPEGYTAKEITGLFDTNYPDINKTTLGGLLKAKEGYLFPDTYFLSPLVTEQEIVDTMTSMFDERTKKLESLFTASKYTKVEHIIMASIIEGEAFTDKERPIVAGILWKRLEKGMALQVDATFAYTLGKASKDLTVQDLKTDSPYNTYTRKGLPPTPIGNPGLPSIEASLKPESSPYWYYLHDTRGSIHYARTYEEHLQNKKLYLK